MPAYTSLFQNPRPNRNRRLRVSLRLCDWPARDRKNWAEALQSIGPFDENGPGSHLSERTRTTLLNAYGRWLGFLSRSDGRALAAPPATRATRERVTAFAHHLAETNRASSVASQLRHLRGALVLFQAQADWAWLLTIAKRIDATAERRSKRERLRTSDELLDLGLRLMAEADEAGAATKRVSKESSLLYRDGLIIALLSTVPMRRRNLAALALGKNVQWIGSAWRVILDPAETKTSREQEFDVGSTVSAALDRYLLRYRPTLSGSSRHRGLWASAKGVPMTSNAVYDAVGRRTKAALGTAVNLHLFRHADATFWALRAPDQIAGASALLGHAHPKTLRYYNQAGSIQAGRHAAESSCGCAVSRCAKCANVIG
jgi:site-specific recombinase XerD